MNIPIQETAGQVEKVEKEEEDTQEVLTLESNVRTSCVSSSLESLKKDKKPAEPTVDEEEEDRRA